MQIGMLRARLDSVNGLTDTQESELIAKMRESARATHRSWLHRESSAIWADTYRPFTTTDPAGTCSFRRFRHIAQTDGFLRRIHDQAVTLVTPEQLRRCEEIQAQQLSSVRVRFQQAYGIAEAMPK